MSLDKCLLRVRSLSRHGRVEEAGDILTSFAPGRAVAIEKALLDLHRARPAGPIGDIIRSILETKDVQPTERLRALLVLGIVEHRLDREEQAMRALLECLALAEVTGDGGSRIDALRAIGVVHAWRGRQAQAVLQQQLALADAAASGDQSTVAVLLGDLAASYFEAGQYVASLAFLQRQTQLSAYNASSLTRLRRLELEARTLLGLKRYKEAARIAESVAAEADALGLSHLCLMSLRTLALAHIRQGQAMFAATALQRAERHLPDETDSYGHLIVRATRVEFQALADPARSVIELVAVVQAFARRNLPSAEIGARLLEADLRLQLDQPAEAEVTLRIALAKACLHGLDRHAEDIRQALARCRTATTVTLASSAAVGLATASDLGASGQSYILLGKLGSGGAGTVFRAFDVHRARYVALKRTFLKERYDGAEREEAIRRAHNELEAASRIVHPGFARVLGIGTEADGTLYVVQDLIDGPSLRQIMARVDDGNEAKLICLERLALTIAALHRGGVVHRDLKPDNVVCPSIDQPVIVDFGLAKIIGGAAAPAGGTPGYAAPEQMEEACIDGRVDLYALGVVAFEWLCGRLPTGPATRAFPAVLSDLLLAEVDATLLQSTVGPRVSAIVTRLLAADPSERFDDASEVAMLLAKVRMDTCQSP